ncbi:MAG: tRNA pseudouridine38-40 synthase [Pseudomonadota bacterium]|nr:tRNA pseudouridine38-40 synthase [Pseudomonadota bacterium]
MGDHASLYNLAMLVEYDGSKFCGFQKQGLLVRTIQGELEQALSNFANQSIEVITSGRTDSGVHAVHQVINFKTSVERKLNNWVRGVNALLPKDIVIKDVVVVGDTFNSRFSAVFRTYHYYLQLSPVRPVILYNKVGWYHAALDVELMQSACQLLIGEQDFSSFRAANCQAQNPVRNLTHASIEVKNNLLRFEFRANAFLYHMIRNIVGALIYVGNGKITLNQFMEVITVKNRRSAPPTFMPDGLYLVNVEYLEQIFSRQNIAWLY